MIEITDQLIYAFAGEPEITATDAHAIRVGLTAVLALVERDHVAPLRAALDDFVDPDPCWYDHNGGCQAHGYISLEPGEKCPVLRAKELL
jgi:hypothetical protein